MLASGTARSKLEVRVEKPGLVTAAAEFFLPELTSLLAENAEEQEDEESLKRSENGEEDLKRNLDTASAGNCECPEQP